MSVELATAYVNLVPSAKGIGAGIARELGAPLNAAALAAGKQTSTLLGGTLLTNIGGLAKKATLPFVGLGVAAVASAKGVEDAQNTILRSTGATGDAAEGLLVSFRKIARNTPASFATVATTLSEVSQRTGLTGKRLEDLTLQIVTFNRITKDSPVAVQDLTKALSSFNVPGAKMGEVLDRLFVTSQKTGVPLNDLVSTLQSAGPVVRQFGLPIEQAAGLLATLDKAGVDAGPAIFGLRKAFTTFAKAGKEPKEALQAIIGQIQNLAKAGDLAAARKIGVDLFGARGVGIVDAAVNGKLSLEALTKTFDSTGKGIRATASSTSTMSAKLGVLKNNAQLALAELGGPLLNIATASLKAIVPVVQKLASVFTALPGPVQGVAVGMVALGAVAGPIGRLAKGIAGVGRAAFGAAKGIASAAQATVSFFKAGNATKLLASFGKAGSAVLSFSKNVIIATANIVKQTAAFVAQKAAMLAAAAAQKVVTVATWLFNAALAANPIGLVVVAIAALAAGIFLAYKKCKPFRDIVNAVGRALKTAFDWVKSHWPLILGILTGPFGIALLVIKKFGPQILSGIKTAFSAVVSFFTGLPGRIVSALATAGSAFVNLGKKFVGWLLTGAKAALGVYLAFYVKLPLRVLGTLKQAGTWLVQTGVKVLAGMLRGVRRGEVAVLRFFATLAGRILERLTAAASWLVGVGVRTMAGLLRGITNGSVSLFNFFRRLPGRILAFFVGAGRWLVEVGKGVLLGFGNGIISGAGAVLDWLGGLKDRIIGAVGNARDWLFDVGHNIIGGLLDGIKDALGGVKDFLGGVGKKIVSWKGPPAKDAKLLIPIGGIIMGGLVKGIAAELPALQKQLSVVSDQFAKSFAPGSLDFGLPKVVAPVKSTPFAPQSVRQTVQHAVDIGTFRQAEATRQVAAAPPVLQFNAPIYGFQDFERQVIEMLRKYSNRNPHAPITR